MRDPWFYPPSDPLLPAGWIPPVFLLSYNLQGNPQSLGGRFPEHQLYERHFVYYCKDSAWYPAGNKSKWMNEWWVIEIRQGWSTPFPGASLSSLICKKLTITHSLLLLLLLLLSRFWVKCLAHSKPSVHGAGLSPASFSLLYVTPHQRSRALSIIIIWQKIHGVSFLKTELWEDS